MPAPTMIRESKVMTDSPARTRYAPSPTGKTHLGNLRTAMFAWLLARHSGGQFILRIEDTDQTRLVEGAQAELMDAMRWLGLLWDEGPDLGGRGVPYVQSENLPAYGDAARNLVARGHAYYCDCTPERLDVVRKMQQQRGQPPRYDNHCRERGLGAGEGRVIRFKMPTEGVTICRDHLRGDTRFENALIGDPVILKSDQFPTYHLAVIVDDQRMAITHVLRGQEWLPSTPIHQQIYAAFGWQAPVWVHLPLVTDFQGKKIKKRDDGQGADEEYAKYVEMTRIDTLREKGYMPAAVMNFLAFLGWNPGTTEELFTPAELSAAFSLDRLSLSPAVFDVDRLDWFNQQHLRRLPPAELAAGALPYLKVAYPDAPRLDDSGWVDRLLGAVKEELITVGEVAEKTRFAFIDPVDYHGEVREHLQSAAAEIALNALREALPAEDAVSPETAEAIFKTMRAALKTSHNLGGKAIMQPLRAALTGVSGGPHLTDILVLIGAGAARRRLDQALTAVVTGAL